MTDTEPCCPSCGDTWTVPATAGVYVLGKGLTDIPDPRCAGCGNSRTDLLPPTATEGT